MRTKTLATAAALFLAATAALPDENLPTVKIGVCLEGVSPASTSLVEASLKEIRLFLDGEGVVETTILSEQDLRHAVERQVVDLVVAPASHARRHILAGARDLASAVPSEAANANMAEGSVFLVDGESDLASLADARGARVVTSGSFGTQGIDSIRAAVAMATGDDPSGFFSETTLLEPDVEEILDAVRSGRADIAVLPSCALERESRAKILDTGWLRVLEPRQASGFRCAHSTLLHPGTTVISLPTLSPGASREVTRALLGMGRVDGMAWSIATDFGNVDKTLFALDQDAWAERRRSWISGFFLRHWRWLAGGAAAVLFLFLHSVLTAAAVRRKTLQLTEAFEERERLLKSAAQADARLAKLQKISVIGQMSSLFAHEMRQPLTAIACYAHGLRRMASRDGSGVPPPVAEGLDEIEGEVRKAGEIISRIREYVKPGPGTKNVWDWGELVDSAIGSFKTTSLGQMRVEWERPSRPVPICVDPLEMELIVTNLLRNSAEAQAGNADPWARIALVLESSKGCARLSVSDNGPRLDDERLDAVRGSGDSTKAGGLGLGLSIVRSLIEGRGGGVVLDRSGGGGLRVTVTLPTWTKEGENG